VPVVWSVHELAYTRGGIIPDGRHFELESSDPQEATKALCRRRILNSSKTPAFWLDTTARSMRVAMWLRVVDPSSKSRLTLIIDPRVV